MRVEHEIRMRICRFGYEACYPVEELGAWLLEQGIKLSSALKLLDELQERLDLEAEVLRRRQAAESIVRQQQYWCVYCAQARAYCRELVEA